MKLKFLKGTKLYKEEFFAADCNSILLDSGKTLDESFECNMPEKDYSISIAGAVEVPVSENTRIHYKEDLYLKIGDASNYKISVIVNSSKIYNWLSEPLFGTTKKVIIETDITGCMNTYDKENIFFVKYSSGLPPNIKTFRGLTRFSGLLLGLCIIGLSIYLYKRKH